ncbi:hypothetical protein B0F90DRAFT_1783024 [Multifurca ochricompacta]|uniref:Uncharacterized protein n=1 Tax=Multifurca ochricompacta TaxID=376703 RepID=A0AAD4LWX7_9AGAM|nr:hypothetical protein B0F90DRAFT_1783024 [Multifurca ochricompacta]
MATVTWLDLPALSQHHDFHPAARAILDHAREIETLYSQPATFKLSDRDQLLLDRTARRNNVYYPQDFVPPSGDVEYKSRDMIQIDGGTAERAAYQTSWCIWNVKHSLDRRWLIPWDELYSWGSLGPANSEVSMRYSQYWLKFDAKRDWFGIYNLCRTEAENDPEDLRIKLVFSLSAASYSQSKYANVVPLILIFATDHRFRGLKPPSHSYYDFSDELSPSFTRLKNMIRNYVHHTSRTPAQSERERTRRNSLYGTIMETDSSVAARSKITLWKNPGRSLDIREEWFDKSNCEERVENYRQSISRNNEVKAHIQELQDIISHYGNQDALIPHTFPRSFATHYSIGTPRATVYSLSGVLVSRSCDASQISNHGLPTFPAPYSTLPSTVVAESSQNHVCTDDLYGLITELRQGSLIQLYGGDLKRSLDELLRQDNSRAAQRGIPFQDSLHVYREECLSRKNMIFCKIAGALVPFQRAEEVSSIAGLWPRLTPRSILRQLTRDRISSLPDWYDYGRKRRQMETRKWV